MKVKKNKSFNDNKRVSMIFFETFVQKQNDNLFFRDPNKKVDKRKSRKVMSRSAYYQYNMEQTRNEDDSRRKKTRDETPKKGGFKKQRHDFI